MTLIELIEAMATRLNNAGVSFGHGTTNAFDEAAWLTLWRLGMPIDALDQVTGMEVGPDKQALVASVIDERIRTRRPAAYITREAWLQGVPFYVDERVIVPRSFIAELLADGAIDPWLSDQTRQVLDLCTGNGSLAILAAMAYPEVQVEASDISVQALEVARVNVRRHHLDERIRLCESDGFGRLRGIYDLILCNPPYVNSSSMALLPPEFRSEPALALAGGVDGMDLIRRLLREAPQHMSPQAVMVLEIGHERVHFETAFPYLEAIWFSTSAGDEQVMLLTREALLAAHFG